MGVEYRLDGFRTWSGHHLLLYRRHEKSIWETEAGSAIAMQFGPCDGAGVRFGWRGGPATAMEPVNLFDGLPTARQC